MNDQCLNCRIRKSCYYKEPDEDWTCEHYGYFNGLLGEIDKVENGGEEVTNEQIGEAYQRGLDDAWECARELYLNGVCKDLFGEYFHTFIKNHTATEAIAKLKAYEEKQNDKIEVGDEVDDDGRPDTVVVVTYIGQDGFIDGMDGRGTQYAHKNPTKWTKTGRHFDIASTLEDMRND